MLRSDNVVEYTSNEFKGFYMEVEIKRELTLLYNPQQNGIVERKNRTIVGATNVMIHDQGLPMFLWVEACNTTIYLQNRSPHKAMEDKILQEAFTGVKPEVSHLRIFGSLVYVRIPS